MISSMGAALAGMAANRTLVDVAARNVANVNTDRFQRQEVVLQAGPGGGVSASVRTDPAPGPIVERTGADGATLVPLSNVDLGRELVDLILGSRGFEAGIETVRTQDEMLGSLLDLKG